MLSHVTRCISRHRNVTYSVLTHILSWDEVNLLDRWSGTPWQRPPNHPARDDLTAIVADLAPLTDRKPSGSSRHHSAGGGCSVSVVPVQRGFQGTW